MAIVYQYDSEEGYSTESNHGLRSVPSGSQSQHWKDTCYEKAILV